MIQSEAARSFYVPQGSNLYEIRQTSFGIKPGINAFYDCGPMIHEAESTRMGAYDDDPLTAEELADLEISLREISEGKGIEKPGEMPVRDFLNSL